MWSIWVQFFFFLLIPSTFKGPHLSNKNEKVNCTAPAHHTIWISTHLNKTVNGRKHGQPSWTTKRGRRVLHSSSFIALKYFRDRSCLRMEWKEKKEGKYGSNVPDVNSTCNRMLPDLLTDFRSRVASIEERRHKTHKNVLGMMFWFREFENPLTHAATKHINND